MRAADIVDGGVYTARVSGAIVSVRVDRSFKRYESFQGKVRTLYYCTNLRTGRKIVVRSAQRFRSAV